MGVAVVRLDNSAAAATDPVAVNTTILLSEHSPDVTWDGASLLVAWEDDSMTESWERRLCTRKLTSDLSPIGAEECEWSAGANRSTASYAATSSGPAIAWREEAADSAALQLRYAGLAWTIPLDGFPAATEPPALLELDGGHLLVLYTSGVGSQLSMIADSSGGQTGPGLMNPLPMAARIEPALAKTVGGVYLAWREPTFGAGQYLAEVRVQKGQWDGTALTWVSGPISIPYPDAFWLGDQTKPALASEPFVPSGALVAAWNDLAAGAGGPVHGDVLVSLLPTPIVHVGGSEK